MRKRNRDTRESGARQREDKRRPPVATGRPDAARVSLFRFLLYILPLALVFSYFPVISLGSNETMNFELSLTLIWLVLFDLLAFVMIVRKYRAQIFSKVFGSILWWLFPLFVTFSVLWSLNVTRGLLTVGLMWAIFFAVIAFWELRENLDAKFWKVFWRWFFGSALFVCGWCLVQCVLDVSGCSQDVSLLCDGCVYQMFGFPHPNGFAIEPQFMGNLLIAPVLVAAGFCRFSGRVAAAHRHGGGALVLALPRSGFPQTWQKLSPLLFFVFSATLFLTFSRGAIYACVVGLLFMFGFYIAKAKKKERKEVLKSALKTLAIFMFSFVFTLNLQGIFSAVAPTSDTYGDGVAKVINHLSLGVIDVRSQDNNWNEMVPDGEVSNAAAQPVFDGYVAESTDTRVRLSTAAFEIWKMDAKTMLVGVGIGGAGQALYNYGYSPAPKEIVQNEYASLFLEVGLVGVLLFALIIALAVWTILKRSKVSGTVLALVVAYAVTLLFFSGFPNAIQILLLPPLLALLTW